MSSFYNPAWAPAEHMGNNKVPESLQPKHTLRDAQASQACFHLIYFKDGVIWILHIRVSYTCATCK